MCAPLGASMAFKGIRACLPLIHGSQGCATYIRRYMISHFREPVDIASSSFSEETTIFGGNKNFNTSINNIISQYSPEVIAIASTCLSETIGEDIPKLISEYKSVNASKKLPTFIHASTPSYQGSHSEGFHAAVSSIVKTLAVEGKKKNQINLFPGMVSPEDIRHLKEIMLDFNIKAVVIPDYSETLDSTNWDQYKLLPDGGTSVKEISSTGSSIASVEFGQASGNNNLSSKSRLIQGTAAGWLEESMSVPRIGHSIPVGIKETDEFFNTLKSVSGQEMPLKYAKERGRLIDAYVDGHKYMFGKRAVIVGDLDMVVSLFAFLEETGIQTVLVASGSDKGVMKEVLSRKTNRDINEIMVMEDADYESILEILRSMKPEIILGNSKSYSLAKTLNIPLIRVGFPIHDRFGGQRTLHVAYRGTQHLYDRIANAIMEHKQNTSRVGYQYL